MQAPKSSGNANGIDGPLNPFVITPPPPDASEDEIPGYVKRFGAYVSHLLLINHRNKYTPTDTGAKQHTLTEGVL